MYTIVFTYAAETDLDAIYQYIAQDSPARASAYIEKIEKHILSLRDFPLIGTTAKYSELARLGIRILPFEDYLVFYTVAPAGQTVTVLRILNGSVDYKTLF